MGEKGEGNGTQGAKDWLLDKLVEETLGAL